MIDLFGTEKIRHLDTKKDEVCMQYNEEAQNIENQKDNLIDCIKNYIRRLKKNPFSLYSGD